MRSEGSASCLRVAGWSRAWADPRSAGLHKPPSFHCLTVLPSVTFCFEGTRKEGGRWRGSVGHGLGVPALPRPGTKFPTEKHKQDLLRVLLHSRSQGTAAGRGALQHESCSCSALNSREDCYTNARKNSFHPPTQEAQKEVFFH